MSKGVMDYRSLILITTAVMHLSVGGFAFRRNPRGSANRALFLLCISLTFWALLTAIIWHPLFNGWVLGVGRLVHVVSMFCGAGMVYLCTVFPTPIPWFRPRIRTYVWVLGGILGTLVVSTPYLIAHAEMTSTGLSAVYGPLKYAYFLYVASCLFGGLALLIWRFRHSTGLPRLQVAYFLAGCGFSVLLNVPTNIAAPFFGIHSLGWLGPTFTLIFSTLVTHAIVRHRLMGMRVFIGRRIADITAFSIAAALFAGVFHVLIRLHAEMHPTLLWVAAIIAGLLFQPIHSRMQIAIGRYFYRPAYDYHEAVLNATRVFAAPLDLDKTRAYLLETINRLLRVEHIRFYTQAQPDGEFLLHASQVAWPDLETAPSQPETITRESPLIQQILHQQEPLVREEMETLPKPIAADVVAEMTHMQAAVAVPLLSGGSLVA
ncbi:MAG TPA: histidine kinase N-terminal 7TM domain-containing protein, partial [Armatimonadota bacterium]|nr:histidine kinase N-terminal 7TM domain-containing protein [Armatimonadota bacterium]